MIIKPRILNRVLSAFINFFLLIMVTFTFDAIASSKVMALTTNYNQLTETFNGLSQEFKTLEDTYNIYIYKTVEGQDEPERVRNDKITAAEIEAFNNDVRVNEIVKEANAINATKASYSLVSLIISYVISIFLVYYLPCFFFKNKHFNIGNKMFHIVMLKNDDYMKKSAYFGYESIRVLAHVLIGPFTLFLFNLADIFVAGYSKTHTSLLERILKIDLAVDPDKVEENTMSEERLYELSHQQTEKDPLNR